MYSYDDAPPHHVLLDSAASYEVTVTYAHDIRNSGAPKGEDGVPRERWSLQVEEVAEGVFAELSRSIVPGVVRGWVLGGVVGVEVRNVGRSAVTVTGVTSLSETVRPLLSVLLTCHLISNLPQMSVSILAPTTLAPFQTRLIPLSLRQLAPFPSSATESYELPLLLHLSTESSLTLTLSLPSSLSSGPLLSTFLSNTGTPSYSLYTPPSSLSASSGTILALHGAGVDPVRDLEWTRSIPRRTNEWIVWPLGLTEWVRSIFF